MVEEKKTPAAEAAPAVESTPVVEEKKTPAAEAAPAIESKQKLENDNIKVDEIKSINEPSSDNSINIEDLKDTEENKNN